MNYTKLSEWLRGIREKRRLRASIYFVLCFSMSAFCDDLLWWNNFPRILLGTTNPQDAVDYHASATVIVSDLSWGTYFSQQFYARQNTICSNFQAVGVKSIFFQKGTGATWNYVSELSLTNGTPAPILHSNGDWANYSGGPIQWIGAWTYFDNPWWAGPWTYGSPGMYYPNGIVATGFFNNVTNSWNDPRNSRVYDASCERNVKGDLYTEYTSTAGPTNGLIYMPGDNAYTGRLMLRKDISCPYWHELDYAANLAIITNCGLQGTWADIYYGGASFTPDPGPVDVCFGKWAEANFQTYLTNNFSAATLTGWGVLRSGQTSADITNFYITAYLTNKATTVYGWDGSANWAQSAWTNSAWLDDPVWRAYMISRQQDGRKYLDNFYAACKQAAADAGVSDYPVMGNMMPCYDGWVNDNADMPLSETALGKYYVTPVGTMGIPPFSRYAPYYKTAQSTVKGQFGAYILYDNWNPMFHQSAVAKVLYYEMLRSDAMPVINLGVTTTAGDPATDKAFFEFVADTVVTNYGARTPMQEIGVYFSSSSKLAMTIPGLNDRYNQPQTFANWGWGTVLDKLHYQYAMIPEQKLTLEALRKLKMLVIPNAVSFREEDVELLYNWVHDDGGILIVTGDSGAKYGEDKNFDTAPALLLAPLTTVTNIATATDRTVVLGAGRVRYLTENLGENYYLEDAAGRNAMTAQFTNELSTLCSDAGYTPLVTSDAPDTVGLSLFEDPGAEKLFLDVNNYNILTNGTNAWINTAGGLTVHIRKPGWFRDGNVNISAISPDGTKNVRNVVIATTTISFTVPSFDYYVGVIMAPDLTDSDRDGLPDWWENQYFGNPTNAVASDDSDGDGMSNLAEYIGSYDPTNPASHFTGTLKFFTEGHVLVWNATGGHEYDIYWSTNLLGGFDLLQKGIYYPQNSYTDNIHAAVDTGFYQISTQQQ